METGGKGDRAEIRWSREYDVRKRLELDVGVVSNRFQCKWMIRRAFIEV